MKVLVIGATGGTGRIAVKKLLARGDEVTAFARNPADVKETSERLKVAKGDARDAASLDAALAGQDAVLCAFGPRSLKKDDLQEALMKNLVPAMQKRGVKRIVNLSALGAGDSAAAAGVLFAIFRATLLRHVYADKNRAEPLLLSSGLDFVNVRPGRLLDAPARGGVKATMNAKEIKPEMTREDLAEFMVGQLSSDTWVKKSPIIGY